MAVRVSNIRLPIIKVKKDKYFIFIKWCKEIAESQLIMKYGWLVETSIGGNSGYLTFIQPYTREQKETEIEFIIF